MPDIAGVRVGRITESDENVTYLAGTPQNPAREPKSKANAEKGTLGDTALMDALIIVGLAWVGIVLLAYSLRHHNV